MTTFSPKTYAEAVNIAVNNAAAAIRTYISMEWTREDAINHVKNNSTFGPQSWARVMELVNEN